MLWRSASICAHVRITTLSLVARSALGRFFGLRLVAVDIRLIRVAAAIVPLGDHGGLWAVAMTTQGHVVAIKVLAGQHQLKKRITGQLGGVLHLGVGRHRSRDDSIRRLNFVRSLNVDYNLCAPI